MRALLDINVLIALLDADHVHHARARDWLRAHAADGWASCPLTQNGCVRIMSQPAYPNALPTRAVVERLSRATRHPQHQFWPDDVSLLDPSIVELDRIHGPRQVTDLYLLALAVRHGGTFATLDGRVPISAVADALAANLCVL
jgi:uncharacterized protein